MIILQIRALYLLLYLHTDLFYKWITRIYVMKLKISRDTWKIRDQMLRMGGKIWHADIRIRALLR